MKIQTISYRADITNSDKLKSTIELINNSKSDLLLFSGHTIGSIKDIEKLRSKIENKKTEAYLELEDIGSEKINNCLYKLSKGNLISLNTNQLFSTSHEIEDNVELAQRLIYEFKSHRIQNIKRKRILIIQCGEFNILKNFQNKNNEVAFRLYKNKGLNSEFKKIINNIDIIWNPMHSPMGNQGKMHKRREFLSRRNNYYFSASNTNSFNDRLDSKGLQYAYFNGNKIQESNKTLGLNHFSRVFEI